VVLFSIAFVVQYPITGRAVGSITIVFLCVVFIRSVLLPIWKSAGEGSDEREA
jgi:hypothetical protein